MSQTHSVWHTPRKIWHISACLAILPIFFAVQLFVPVYWPETSMVIIWLVTIILVAVDLIRMYFPGSNDFILNLPLLGFFRTIWRNHEITGYAASTYSVLALALVMTLVYCGLAGEQVLVASIMVMALCDPAASLTRSKLHNYQSPIKRLASFLVFVGSCLLILLLIGFVYGSLNLTILISAAIASALGEVYVAKLWGLVIIGWNKFIPTPNLPLWLSSIYPDDNLTSPIILALILTLLRY